LNYVFFAVFAGFLLRDLDLERFRDDFFAVFFGLDLDRLRDLFRDDAFFAVLLELIFWITSELGFALFFRIFFVLATISDVSELC
jgi:hypothetical protein